MKTHSTYAIIELSKAAQNYPQTGGEVVKNKRDIIIIIISSLLFFGIYSFSYFTRNYTEIKPDITVRPASPSESTEPAASSCITTDAKLIVAATTTVTTSPLYMDINTASKEELMKLDGIGEVLADAIISYRENCGPFNNIEELYDSLKETGKNGRPTAIVLDTVKGKGIPYFNGRGRGDHVLRVVIEVPKHLSEDQKKMLREFDRQTFDDKHYVKSKSFFDKIKDKIKK